MCVNHARPSFDIIRERSLSRSTGRFPASTGYANHYCYPALWDFRVCFSRNSFSRRKQAEGEVFSGSLCSFRMLLLLLLKRRERERETDKDRETRLEGKGGRIRSSLWIYFVLVRSSTRTECCLFLRLPIATCRYIGFARYCVYISIYIYTYIEFLRTRVSVIYSRHARFVSAKCVGWARGPLVGMTVGRERRVLVARGTKLAFGKPGRER